MNQRRKPKIHCLDSLNETVAVGRGKAANDSVGFAQRPNIVNPLYWQAAVRLAAALAVEIFHKTNDLKLRHIGKGVGEHERVRCGAEDEQGLRFHPVAQAMQGRASSFGSARFRNRLTSAMMCSTWAGLSRVCNGSEITSAATCSVTGKGRAKSLNAGC